jgi:hypothetical protein
VEQSRELQELVEQQAPVVQLAGPVVLVDHLQEPAEQ